MQSAGATVSYNIVIGISKDIVSASDCTPVKENSRKIEFSMKLAKSLFKKIGFWIENQLSQKCLSHVDLLRRLVLLFPVVLNVLLIHLTPPKICS